jgi:FkbM family methyltransferase
MATYCSGLICLFYLRQQKTQDYFMKRMIRSFFNRFGYDIVKTEDWFISKKSKKNTAQVGNYKILMPGDNTLSTTYLIHPDFNSHLGRLAAVIAKKYPDMTAVDIGANVGDTIAIVKTLIDIPVIGIEGDDVSYQYLEKNAAQFSNVTTIKTFLGEKKNDLKVKFESKGSNTTIIPSEAGDTTISFQTLDETLDGEEFKSTRIKLLKLDIEGFDTIVLRGAHEVITKNLPVLFFEYNRDVMEKIKEDGLSTLLSFASYGYNKIAFFDYMGRLLLATTMKNTEEITYLHQYAIGKNNLLGYYDICIFHQQDEALANDFIKAEEN